MWKNVVTTVWVCVCVIATSSFAPAAQDTEAPQWKVRAELAYVSSSGNTDSDTVSARLRIIQAAKAD